jgi:hypothetical protein
MAYLMMLLLERKAGGRVFAKTDNLALSSLRRYYPACTGLVYFPVVPVGYVFLD